MSYQQFFFNTNYLMDVRSGSTKTKRIHWYKWYTLHFTHLLYFGNVNEVKI